MANEIDVTVYGATGFTGTLIAEYAASRMAAGGFSLALAGRNPDKLAAVKTELGLGDDVELIVADGDDVEALTAMAERSKVVIAAAGPYLQYGSRVVEACVATGTDYVDLCGEPNWMRTTIDTHSDAAASTGARIVHSCGFDSVPSDLGVFRLQALAHAEQGKPIARVKGRVRDIRGSASGGTVASFMATMAASQADPEVGANVLNPHGLTASQSGVAQPDGTKPVYDEDLGQWASPFVMALINTKTIHRSNDLLGGHYGDIEYDEMVSTGSGDEGKAMADALAASGGGMDGESMARKPGEGPDKAEREAGGFTIAFLGDLDDGRGVEVTVTGHLDPGYGCTSKMITESALCLLQDGVDADGGIWTPAAVMGDALIERMAANGVLTFTESVG